ncbi:MAG: YceI family protein [Candidatus Sulfotelmatobacter sp.]|jgi:polyisoprenoid-binding protein YceI
MKENAQAFLRSRVRRAIVAVLFLSSTVTATAQNVGLQLDPQHTSVNFTLGDVLHTVRGTFELKRGALRLDPASGKLTGEVIVDAKSGQSGNGMRDRKMHREVLESDRYPEIVFRPDRVDGAVLLSGTSSVHVHGIFAIHGAEHELTVPAEVKIAPGYWTATLHFAVPYVQWGIKNPSTLFLRVSESVDIDLTASGNLTQP